MITETTDITVNAGHYRSRRRVPASAWLPLILLPPVVIAFESFFAGWVFMWLLAFAIFFGCKWFTWRMADRSTVTRGRSLAYLLAWPGMDAREFLAGASFDPPRTGDWVRAACKTILGVVLLGLAAAGKLGSSLMAGWAAMIGLILLLHFGAFHLLALVYRSAGFAARPLMRSPLLAESVADFWANRWNAAFNKLAHDLVFRRLARQMGAVWAALSVFVISGLIHDVVISLPARGGYGLPTAYFALQGVAVLFEKSRAGARLGLGHGLRGRIYLLAVTAVPAPLLFPPIFVRNIILPMLESIGRLWGTP